MGNSPTWTHKYTILAHPKCRAWSRRTEKPQPQIPREEIISTRAEYPETRRWRSPASYNDDSFIHTATQSFIHLFINHSLIPSVIDTSNHLFIPHSLIDSFSRSFANLFLHSFLILIAYIPSYMSHMLLCFTHANHWITENAVGLPKLSSTLDRQFISSIPHDCLTHCKASLDI